ncbi:hypothetical protein Nizo2264_2118 [Lactiplantibacillus plantarum]|nr:hypothetical protein Nizo2264_2118 [Lactiplantibacillus plantarum]
MHNREKRFDTGFSFEPVFVDKWHVSKLAFGFRQAVHIQIPACEFS